jgi:hypothetical protein
MKISLLSFLVILPLVMSGCNLYGGLSKPSDDNQYLVAARACLDSGDYPCAINNYNALSSQYNDEKVSELGLTLLAQENIFSISDLVASLGDNLGSSASFAFLAVALQQRGVTGGAARTTIKQVYDSDSGITDDTKLLAFSRFIATLAMMNEVLANAVGANGTLTAADIVATPATCNSSNGTDIVACAAPAGTALTYDSNDHSAFTNAGTSGTADWSGPATIQKLITAASQTASEFSLFGTGNTNQSLLDAIQQISQYNAGVGTPVAEAQVRWGITTALNLF